MQSIVFGLGVLAALLVVGFLSIILFKALWYAIRNIYSEGPAILGKIFVSLATGFVAGGIGHLFLNMPFQLSGGIGLATAAITAFKTS